MPNCLHFYESDQTRVKERLILGLSHWKLKIKSNLTVCPYCKLNNYCPLIKISILCILFSIHTISSSSTFYALVKYSFTLLQVVSLLWILLWHWTRTWILGWADMCGQERLLLVDDLSWSEAPNSCPVWQDKKKRTICYWNMTSSSSVRINSRL